MPATATCLPTHLGWAVRTLQPRRRMVMAPIAFAKRDVGVSATTHARNGRVSSKQKVAQIIAPVCRRVSVLARLPVRLLISAAGNSQAHDETGMVRRPQSGRRLVAGLIANEADV